MSADDRTEFAEHQRRSALAIGADQHLQQLSRDALAAAHARDYTHTWRWLGVPIIQLPTDVMVLQEIVWETRPDVIVETGIARGGSMIFFASLLELLGSGRVIGVEIDIRPHNRATIEEHPLALRVDLVEGSSTDPATIGRVRDLVADATNVMVVLDSNHTHEHVLGELQAYAPMVSVGQFLVVADTSVEHLPLPTGERARPWAPGNSPHSAMVEYLQSDDGFEADEAYNAKLLMTSTPGGYLRRVK